MRLYFPLSESFINILSVQSILMTIQYLLMIAQILCEYAKVRKWMRLFYLNNGVLLSKATSCERLMFTTNISPRTQFKGLYEGWFHLLHTRTAKYATTCLFASHLGYAYGVGDKSTARSSGRTYFIGYYDAVNSDYFSQRRQLPAQILAKGLHFPVLPKMQIYLHWMGDVDAPLSNRIPYTRIPNAMQINRLSNFQPFQHFNYQVLQTT